jgi:hypothetical protein
MRYFFLMLVFLFISFGLAFSVLMSPGTQSHLSLVGVFASSSASGGGDGSGEVQVFGSLEVRV